MHALEVLQITDAAHPGQRPGAEAAERLEAVMRTLEGAHGRLIPTRQWLLPGLVVREVRIPAGTLLTGVTHLREHVASVSGDITVMQLGETTRYRGSHTFACSPGVRRIGFAHANTVWLAIHAIPFHMTDPAEIDAYLLGDPGELQTHRLPELEIAPVVDIELAPSPFGDEPA